MTLNDLKNYSPEQLQRLYVAMRADYELFAKVIMSHIVTEVPEFHHQMYQILNKRLEYSAFVLFRGAAKRLSLDTPVLTPNGWVLNKDLRIGDLVIGSNGKPCMVVNISDTVLRPLYNVRTRDGRSALADSEHLWKVRRISGGAGFYKNKEIVMTTQELIDFPVSIKRFDKRYNKENTENCFAIDNPSPIEFSHKEFSVNPYTLGVILGDGSIDKTGYVRIHSSIDDIAETYANVVWENKGVIKYKPNTRACYFSLLGSGHYMRELSLIKNAYNKHIPEEYLYGSVSQRIELLQGLMDTDGTCGAGRRGCSFTSVSKELVDDVVILVRSLGGTASVKENTHSNSSTNSYRVGISLPDSIIPFKLQRKIDKYRPAKRKYNAITSITYDRTDLGRCIQVDSPDKLFVIKDFLLTHNSTISKNIQVTSDICFGKEPFTCLISESIDQASKDLMSVVDELENNELITSLFGEMRGATWNKEEIEASNGCYVKCRGYGSRIRGLKWKSSRITKCILDDYESEENTRTGPQRTAVYDWIEAQILRTGEPGTNNNNYTAFQFFGTIVHPEAHLAKIKHLSDFAAPYGAYLEVPIETNGVPAWPTRFPMSWIKKNERSSVEKNKLGLWLQEMYHIPSVSGKPRFDISLIRPYEAEFHCVEGVTYLESASGVKTPINVFIGVDPASTVSESADNSIFFVLGVMPDKTFVILDIIVEKILPLQQAKKIEQLVDKYFPVWVRIETQGYQGALVDICKDRMASGGSPYSIREFKSNRSKDNKFLLGLEPYINGGRFMYLTKASGYDQFVKECTNYNESRRDHDDTIDGAYLASMDAYAPAMFNVDQLISEIRNRFKSHKKKNWMTI